MFETPQRPSRVIWIPRSGNSVRNQAVVKTTQQPAAKGVSREFFLNCYES